eukprot:Sspe_Gene.91714::Locus_63316_Transcript_1_1_Confidence_1.000_Length_548::g.91714::m.91714
MRGQTCRLQHSQVVLEGSPWGWRGLQEWVGAGWRAMQLVATDRVTVGQGAMVKVAWGVEVGAVEETGVGVKVGAEKEGVKGVEVMAGEVREGVVTVVVMVGAEKEGAKGVEVMAGEVRRGG